MMGNSIIKILYWPLFVILVIVEWCHWLRLGKQLGIGIEDDENDGGATRDLL